MKEAFEAELQAQGLQVKQETITKSIQLYETKNSRHSTMIVGQTLSGKTVSWRTLQGVMGRLNKAGESGFQVVRVLIIIMIPQPIYDANINDTPAHLWC